MRNQISIFLIMVTSLVLNTIPSIIYYLRLNVRNLMIWTWKWLTVLPLLITLYKNVLCYMNGKKIYSSIIYEKVNWSGFFFFHPSIMTGNCHFPFHISSF